MDFLPPLTREGFAEVITGRRLFRGVEGQVIAWTSADRIGCASVSVRLKWTWLANHARARAVVKFGVLPTSILCTRKAAITP